MNTESPNKTETLFGGRIVTVLLIDGSTEEIKVRQLLLTEYERALPLLSDEIALTAFCCAKPEITKALDKAWANTLQPESYESLQAIVREVNARGFFSYAARKTEKEREENEQWIRAAATLPPEALKEAIAAGTSASPTRSLRPQRIPA